MLRVAADPDAEAVIGQVRALAPDLLALSLTTRQWLGARALVGSIRQALDIPVIAGGHHPHLCAGNGIGNARFRLCVRGRGGGGPCGRPIGP